MTSGEVQPNLANYLGSYAKKFPSQKEFAARLGIAADYLSHIINGKRANLSTEVVSNILNGLSHDPEAQYHVLRAYLWERIPSDFKGILRIHGSPRGRLKEQRAAYGGDAAALRIAEILKQPYAPAGLADVIEKLTIVAIDCPEMRKVLEDLTKLDIGPKKS